MRENAPWQRVPSGLVSPVPRGMLRLPHQTLVFDYWQSARGEAPIAPLGAIEPTRLPRRALSHLVLYAVLDNPLRIQVRLEGNQVIERLGRNNRGQFVGEIAGTEGQYERLRWAIGQRSPYWVETRVAFEAHDDRFYSALVLPFGDGGQVSRLLSVVGFD
jgi:hypothetical protein